MNRVRAYHLWIERAPRSIHDHVGPLEPENPDHQTAIERAGLGDQEPTPGTALAAARARARGEGGGVRRPCNDCPWRLDAPRGFWDRQHFLDIWEGCQHDGTRRMGCHKMGKGADARFLPCQGWLRVMGFDAIGVRLAVFLGEASVEEVQDTEGPALVESFVEMMALEGFDIAALPINRWESR